MSNEHITIDRLKKARHVAAQLVLMDRGYEPLFERLENEIDAMEKSNALFDRALAVVNG